MLGCSALAAGASRQGDPLPETTAYSQGKQPEGMSVPFNSSYRTHKVQALSCERLVFKLTGDVEARTALHSNSQPVTLRAASVYLCRRKAQIDNERWLILTETGPQPLTFLLKEDSLRGKFVKAGLERTAWQERMDWFRQSAATGRGLRCGERLALPNSICVTVDFCWSSRPFEKGFLTELPARAARPEGGSVTFFMCGRWLEQHPAEMEALLDLEQKRGTGVIWGLHSWVHPKDGGFMNDLSAAQVREDTLRLEREMLAWGIVPSVFYRFPGLIHDTTRLSTIIDMDLLPIDCDAWVAVQEADHPFGNITQSGSIVLVHGNGNEPKGIARFEAWLAHHPDWKWQPLAEFLPKVTEGQRE
jgi:hypothetical protein